MTRIIICTTVNYFTSHLPVRLYNADLLTACRLKLRREREEGRKNEQQEKEDEEAKNDEKLEEKEESRKDKEAMIFNFYNSERLKSHKDEGALRHNGCISL